MRRDQLRDEVLRIYVEWNKSFDLGSDISVEWFKDKEDFYEANAFRPEQSSWGADEIVTYAAYWDEGGYAILTVYCHDDEGDFKISSITSHFDDAVVVVYNPELPRSVWRG